MGKRFEVKVEKVAEELGVVFGFAMVCKEHGEDYFDTQHENVTEDAMLVSSFGYMQGDRVAKAMHRGRPIGQVVFGFPLTTDIAKALDIETDRTGFLIGMRPRRDVLEKFRSGEFTGFSIGGTCSAYTEVE